MIVAEIHITRDTFGASGSGTHLVRFSSLEQATSEYERIAALLKRRKDRDNDIPKILEVEGENKLSIDFDRICAVGLVDFAKANEQQKGVDDAFPHLFKSGR